MIELTELMLNVPFNTKEFISGLLFSWLVLRKKWKTRRYKIQNL